MIILGTTLDDAAGETFDKVAIPDLAVVILYWLSSGAFFINEHSSGDL